MDCGQDGAGLTHNGAPDLPYALDLPDHAYRDDLDQLNQQVACPMLQSLLALQSLGVTSVHPVAPVDHRPPPGYTRSMAAPAAWTDGALKAGVTALRLTGAALPRRSRTRSGVANRKMSEH